MRKIKILALLLSFIMVFASFAACDKSNDSDKTVASEETEDLSPNTENEENTSAQVAKITVNGVDISNYRIVYDTSFSRNECFEDYSALATDLGSQIKELTAVELSVASDTTAETQHEIILGSASRLVCNRYYLTDTRLELDEMCIMYSEGKILLGATCLAGVKDACEKFIEYVSEQSKSGTVSFDIPNDFDISDKQHVKRIICIGDSITEGLKSTNEAKKSYPANLQKILGAEYDVMNYGFSGATMCSSDADPLYPAHSYINKSGYYDDVLAVADKADYAVIMLGTNDAGGSSMTDLLENNFDTFKADYKANLLKMVNDLRSKNSDIEIVLFNAPETYRAVGESQFKAYLRPFQEQVAQEVGIEFYDIYTYINTNMTNAHFPDNLHPNDEGYAILAQGAAEGLKKVFDLK